MKNKDSIEGQVSTDQLYWTAIEFAVGRFIERLAKTKNKAALSAVRKRRNLLVSTSLGRDTPQVKRRSTNGKRKKQAVFVADSPIK
ncbi:hypothetical protein ALP73_200404 [Pseudomonas coronafaciens pv. garcae]|uniref:hypothetical protein n=1 Tax=Pseudomonas syringae group TaxID=136849 RepID=UPI000F3F6A6F|nr:hypothetical protein [Pseudomonas coronafaciens]RMS04946.1 hypothetical protein ALP73_200404 [Pseudomonas coronafaciens pv. garcae]